LNATQAAILGSLVVSATLTGWLLQNQDDYTDTTGSSAHGPDLFVSGMRLEVMDSTGALHYRIRAGSMNHYPGDDRIALTQPVMEIFVDRQLQWHIESERSELDDKGETVNLLGQVRIQRQETDTSQGLVVLTRDLVVRPDSQTADTEHRAVIESGLYSIEGVGMHADFTTHRLELDSRVQGRFDVSG
jgi:LPS export ABC transporter protein LptC